MHRDILYICVFPGVHPDLEDQLQGAAGHYSGIEKSQRLNEVIDVVNSHFHTRMSARSRS